MNQPAKLSRGRKPGSTKAKKELAEKLRRQGRSNEQIADALGISPRTVTRYLNPSISPELSLEEAMKTLSAKDWMRLFTMPRSIDTEVTQVAVRLFILRLLNYPQWNDLWSNASFNQKLVAIGMKREFEQFLERCHFVFDGDSDLADAFRYPSMFNDTDALWNKVPENQS